MLPGLTITSTQAGPLFDGRARRAVDGFLEEASSEIAQAGVNEVQARLGQVLQNPTGAYESRIVTDLVRGDHVVTDGGVIYGPWLEGTSERNKTSRFKGYSVFRKTVQWLQGRAPDIAQKALPRHLDRMGGE